MRILLVILFFSSHMLHAQKERDLSFKSLPVLTTDQWQALEMDDTMDGGLLIYDSKRKVFMQYNGKRWIELSEGGDIHSSLTKNKDMLSLRSIFLERVEKSSKKNVHEIPKLKKKWRKAMQVDGSDFGLMVYDGSFQLWNGKEWKDLGDGGNFDSVTFGQKSIEGMKDTYLQTWRRKNGIGLYVSQVYSSFYRDETVPNNPFINNLASGWEVGINQNLIYRKYFQARFYLGYQDARVSEKFEGNDLSVIADWKFSGAKIALLPVIFTPGTKDIKLTVGGGFYAKYNFSQDLQIRNFEGLVATSTDDIEVFDYGFQAQVGLQVYRFFIDVNATNQYNYVLKSFDSPKFLGQRFLQNKSYSITLSYNF